MKLHLKKHLNKLDNKQYKLCVSRSKKRGSVISFFDKSFNLLRNY